MCSSITAKLYGLTAASLLKTEEEINDFLPPSIFTKLTDICVVSR